MNSQNNKKLKTLFINLNFQMAREDFKTVAY